MSDPRASSSSPLQEPNGFKWEKSSLPHILVSKVQQDEKTPSASSSSSLLDSPSSPSLESPSSQSSTCTSLNLKSMISIQIPKAEHLSEMHEDHFIFLPHQNSPVSHFALDIGGSLVKMVYFEPKGKNFVSLLPPKSPILPSKEFELSNGGGRICFARFRTNKLEEFVSFIKEVTYQGGDLRCVHATGGGAFKFSALLQEQLGIRIRKVDEMLALITGLNFLLKHMEDQAFIYTMDHLKIYKCMQSEERYPYMLVNIGSGVSIIKVTGENTYERVSGSSLGGGTFWGLCSLLTKCSTFEEMLSLTLKGDNKNVDMMVGDIYGRDYERMGLGADVIASSMAKPIMKFKGDPANVAEFETLQNHDADIAKSLLFMICNNIGQIAYLNAQRFNMKRIFFSGFFIRNHPVTMRSISYAINFWSKGETEAYFLKHEGYIGAIGAFFTNKE